MIFDLHFYVFFVFVDSIAVSKNVSTIQLAIKRIRYANSYNTDFGKTMYYRIIIDYNVFI